MHAECNFSPFRIQTLTLSHPCWKHEVQQLEQAAAIQIQEEKGSAFFTVPVNFTRKFGLLCTVKHSFNTRITKVPPPPTHPHTHEHMKDTPHT